MYLSIDLGSTHFKAGIFDDDLIQQGISRYALTYVQTNGIEVELSIDEVEKGIGQKMQFQRLEVTKISLHLLPKLYLAVMD